VTTMRTDSNAKSYQQTQSLIVLALIADLQQRLAGQHNGKPPLIKVLSEDIGVPESAFTVPAFSKFYVAYRNCWARVAADGGVVSPQQLLAELEGLGASAALVEKWKRKLDSPVRTAPSPEVVRAARTLLDSEIARDAVSLLRRWISTIGNNPSDVRGELVSLSNSLLSLASHSGEEIRAAAIMREADAMGYVPPVSTGWSRLDYALSGGGMVRDGGLNYYEGDIWVVGAPSGHGKSSFGCNLAVNLASRGYASIYVTWEMAKVELIRRMICNIGNITYDVAMNPNNAKSEDELVARKSSIELVDAFVRFYEKPTTVAEIQDAVKRHKIEYGDALIAVIIDHLGISTRKNDRRETWRFLEEFVYEVKAVARQEHVAFICFSQVPEYIEAQLREENKATGADFRGSRGIRMGVDVAMYLCRHNGKDAAGNVNPSFANTTVVQIVKDRRFGHEDWFTMKYDRLHYRLEDAHNDQEERL